MNSPERRRDTEKLQNKRRRQKWHFLRDCCVAFVGRKMKCEDQREMEGWRGHGENGMSKSTKQKRKCARGTTNLWEMRQGVSEAGCWLSDGLGGGVVGGGTGVLQVGGQRRNLWYGSFEAAFEKEKKSELSRKEEMEVKQKKKHTSLLFGGESPWQVERREAKVRRRLGRKQRGGSTRERAQRRGKKKYVWSDREARKRWWR